MEARPPVRHRTRPKTTNPEYEASEVQKSAPENLPGPEIDDCDVGYRKPPKHTRFRPGRSGNPKGRPKGTKNFKTDLAEELQERILVREGGKAQAVSKQRAMLKRLTEKALQGDARAASLIINMVARFLDQSEDDDHSTPLTAEDLRIIENFRARLAGNRDDAPNDKKE